MCGGLHNVLIAGVISSRLYQLSTETRSRNFSSCSSKPSSRTSEAFSVQFKEIFDRSILKKKVALGCLLPVILVFGGCVALLASSDPPVKPTTQTASSKPAAVPLATMGSVRNDRAVQIDRIELVDELSTGNPYVDSVSAGQGKLAVVYTQVQNIGQESGSLLFTTFELVDDAGRKYAEISDFEDIVSVGMWAEAQGLSSSDKQLFPGETASTALVFRVAPDAAGLQVVVNEKTFETE